MRYLLNAAQQQIVLLEWMMIIADGIARISPVFPTAARIERQTTCRLCLLPRSADKV
jgi:hypothetical protein